MVAGCGVRMRYRFGAYSLDSNAHWLRHSGTTMDVPKRVFLCLSYLIRHRERAVTRDELIREIWRHDNASDHQLAQVVLAARKLIGDDGQQQKQIRTVPGVGYHWVGTVEELPELESDETKSTESSMVERAASRTAPESTDVIEKAFPVSLANVPVSTQINASLQRELQNKGRQLNLVVFAALLAIPMLAWLADFRYGADSIGPQTTSVPATLAPEPAVTLETLRLALQKGEFEQVRVGLTRLPEQQSRSLDALFFEIEFDLARARFAVAAEKLAAAGPLVGNAVSDKAQYALLESDLNYMSDGKFGQDFSDASLRALRLLEAEKERSGRTQKLYAQALLARSRSARLQDTSVALQQVIQARELYTQANDELGSARASSSLARIWMRQGRLLEALEEILANAQRFERLQAPVMAIYAYNTAVRINIALLRWRDALNYSDKAMLLLKRANESERRFRTLELRAMVLVGLGRLREADSTLTEANFWRHKGPSQPTTIPIWLLIARGENAAALKLAQTTFSAIPGADDLTYESQDGALLLWVIAAQQYALSGKHVEIPEPMQNKLNQSQSVLATIAQARWLSMKGEFDAANRILRRLLTDLRVIQRPNWLLQSCAPLIGNLIKTGEITDAESTFAACRGHAPDAIDNDYFGATLAYQIAKAGATTETIDRARKRLDALAQERDPVH